MLGSEEPMTTKDWILFFQQRLDFIEQERTRVFSRVLTFAGVAVVSFGIVLGLFDIPALTTNDLRAVAFLWLLISFLGVLGMTLWGLALQRKGAVAIQDVLELTRRGTAVYLAIGGVFLVGAAMTVFLVGDWYPIELEPRRLGTAVLVLATYFFTIVYLVAPFLLRFMRKSLPSLEKSSLQGGVVAGIARPLTPGALVGVVLALVSVLVSLWDVLVSIPMSGLGFHGLVQLVGAGYVGVAALLVISYLSRSASALVSERRKTLRLLHQALALESSPSVLRSHYAEIVRDSAEEEDLYSRFET